MLKIASLHSHHFLNALHLQCATDVKYLTQSSDPATLGILNQYNDFVLWCNREDDAYKYIRKNEITEEKARLDHKRDLTFSGMREYVKSSLYHYDPEISAAARRLMVTIDNFNTIPYISYDAETASITSLIHDLNAQAADVGALKLEGWITTLQTENQEFETLARRYVDDYAAKPAYNMLQSRRGVEKSMRTMFDCINALIVMNGETAYTAYVNSLNATIKHYNDVYAEHIGRYEANKKGEEEAK
ncbi:MAG: DUF6261 family protein [Tannerella sp.]|jgi:hypothetical protein|nr:DUF6261 family protein [Tannerella sp.]